jgi:hypothetical protein
MGAAPISSRTGLAATSLLSGSVAAAVAFLALASPETGCESNDDVLPSDASVEAAVDAAASADAPTKDASSMVSPVSDAASGPSSADGSANPDATSAADAFVSTAMFAQVRVANWSPDAPPVDFCLAPHATADFRGPFVAGLVAAEAEAGTPSDAAVGGLAYPNASAYALVAPGTYDARIVVGTGCSAKIAPDEIALPALSAGSSLTIALVGDANSASGNAALEVTGYLDDGRAGSALALRFIHAAPGLPAVDVGTVSGTAFKALFSNIPFGSASSAKLAPTTADGSAPPVDMNGYLSQSALVGATLRAEPHAGGDGGELANAPGVYAAAGSAVSIVVIGAVSGVPLGLLECVDNAGTVGPLSNCSVISQ